MSYRRYLPEIGSDVVQFRLRDAVLAATLEEGLRPAHYVLHGSGVKGGP